ncbi:MAG TPA: hypothetical protein VNQ50_00700 [Xanthobacteraceae bacterium]|jgi:hypothetical protein|nr:hypothetical protein [Xanthobacteraceae bacterium]
MSIRIHQSEPSPATLKRLVERLEQRAPQSCKNAHEVLVAAKAYAGTAQTAGARAASMQDLQRRVRDLRDSLAAENYVTRPYLPAAELLFAFFSDYSDAHPGWRHEYSTLNRVIPRCFTPSGFPAGGTPGAANA